MAGFFVPQQGRAEGSFDYYAALGDGYLMNSFFIQKPVRRPDPMESNPFIPKVEREARKAEREREQSDLYGTKYSEAATLGDTQSYYVPGTLRWNLGLSVSRLIIPATSSTATIEDYTYGGRAGLGWKALNELDFSFGVSAETTPKETYVVGGLQFTLGYLLDLARSDLAPGELSRESVSRRQYNSYFANENVGRHDVSSEASFGGKPDQLLASFTFAAKKFSKITSGTSTVTGSTLTTASNAELNANAIVVQQFETTLDTIYYLTPMTSLGLFFSEYRYDQADLKTYTSAVYGQTGYGSFASTLYALPDRRYGTNLNWMMSDTWQFYGSLAYTEYEVTQPNALTFSPSIFKLFDTFRVGLGLDTTLTESTATYLGSVSVTVYL